MKSHDWREAMDGEILPESDRELAYAGNSTRTKFAICEGCGAVGILQSWKHGEDSWVPMTNNTLTDCDQEVVRRLHEE